MITELQTTFGLSITTKHTHGNDCFWTPSLGEGGRGKCQSLNILQKKKGWEGEGQRNTFLI